MWGDRRHRVIVMLALCGAAILVLVACGGPSVVGRWQMEGNPDAGIEFRDGGQFQGELGAAGGQRLRMEGTWKASGSDVSLEVGGALAKVVPNLTLVGKIQGDTLTLNPPQNVPGLTRAITLRRVPDRR